MKLILLTLLSAAAVITWAKPAIEVKFIVDKQLEETYKKRAQLFNPEVSDDQVKAILKQDIDYVLGETKLIFDGQEKLGINYELRVSGEIEFLGKNLVDYCCQVDWSGAMTNAVMAWGRENKDKKMDFTMLLSGFTVKGSTIGGNAMRDGMCSVYIAGGWVVFDGTRNSAARLAHEIGHGLGATHDSDQKYLMASHTWNVETSHTFSGQSVSQIKARAQGGHLKCLDTIDSDSRVPEEKEPRKEMTNLDYLCKWAFASKDSFLDTFRANERKNLCYKVECFDPEKNRLRDTYNDGTICGKGKRCQNRQCVAASDPESNAITDEKCMFGDPKVTWWNGKYMTCNEIPKNVCYWDIGPVKCCERCKGV